MCIAFQSKAQYIPLNNSFYEKAIYGNLQKENPQLWGMKPFFIQSVDSVDVLINDVYGFEKKEKDSWIYRKCFYENLIEYKNSYLHFTADPLFDFSIGRNDSVTSWVNTRGVRLEGKFFDQVFANVELYENQAFFPSWIRDFVDSLKVIPGQGKYKPFKQNGFDFYHSSGYLTYYPSKFLHFTLGYGKNFIGEGYRSLILSDVAFNYPYFRAEANLGWLKYTALYSQYTATDLPMSTTLGFQRKWSTMHYLQFMLWKRLNIGIFDAIIWEQNNKDGYRGFDFQYLNPIIFLRPLEFAVGSPDNALVGSTISYRATNWLTVYSQLLLDEFNLKHLVKADGWWANKYSIQLGVSGRNIFGIKDLFALAEFNQVRPYTYSHSDPIQSYSHYNQPLAHILGANFREGVFAASYMYKNFKTQLKLTTSMYGADTTGHSFGQNILASYEEKVQELGNFIGQGRKTNVNNIDFSIAYVLNRKTNMQVKAGIVHRQFSNSAKSYNTTFFNIGFSTEIRNIYYDF